MYATADHFWSIPEEQLFSSEPPRELTAGQLFDSAEFTRHALRGDYLVRYNCVWVADILRGVVDGVVTTAGTAGAKPLQLSTEELVEGGVGALETPAPSGERENRVALPGDAFWTVPPGDVYNVLEDPTSFRRLEVAECLRLMDEDVSSGAATPEGVRAFADLLDVVGRAS
ncbi:MAG: hypothetical protein AAGC66_09175 [Leifsonia sp.]